VIHVILLILALLHTHHTAVVHAVNYKLYPCAKGHPPVSPDWGACIGTNFRPS
jgi:hypothetical protein